MGIDRFSNFIFKSINNDNIEEVDINNNIRKVIANHIIFDLNFLIYQEIIEIENEINDMIKIILCMTTTNKTEIEDLLKEYLNQKHWVHFNNINELNLSDFLCNINDKIEIIIHEKIILSIVNLIDKLHHPEFIISVCFFFDGIPSLSKIIEQRKRRIKNSLESCERKTLFKLYFDNLEPNHIKLSNSLNKNCNEDLTFDYFEWLKIRFTIDKSIGPSSNFIKQLEIYMQNIKKYYPDKIIYINCSNENGESDLKIFKYININFNYGDFCIHTIDSDLIHQILVQQTYYKIINKDINLSVIKYLKSYTLIGYVQILEAPTIINKILELYNNINQVVTNNYKIIWDLCLIFYFFGNDHLPSSIEIGPELGIEFYLKNHYSALDHNNIVNLENGKISLNLENLNLYLLKINETKIANITRIFLQRYFKININLINLFVNILKLDFDNIQIYLKNFIINQSKLLSTEELELLDEDDLRKKYYLEEQTLEINLDETKIKLIIDNINYYEHAYNGLILYVKPLNIINDAYQDLYNYIVNKSSSNIAIKYPQYYEYNDITHHLLLIKNLESNDNSNDYLKKLYHLNIIQFGPMNDFYSDNLTYYKYYNVPSLSNLIDFIKLNKTKNIKWNQEILNENIKTYFNNEMHQKLISPSIENIDDILKLLYI